MGLFVSSLKAKGSESSRKLDETVESDRKWAVGRKHLGCLLPEDLSFFRQTVLLNHEAKVVPRTTKTIKC